MSKVELWLMVWVCFTGLRPGFFVRFFNSWNYGLALMIWITGLIFFQSFGACS